MKKRKTTNKSHSEIVTKTPLLELQGISKNFYRSSKRRQFRPALNDINLKIERGKIYTIIGAKGSGKTVLMRVINKLLIPTAGQVMFKGHPFNAAKAPFFRNRKFVIKAKERIAFLPEQSFLNPEFTLAMYLDFYNKAFSNFNRPNAENFLAQNSINIYRKNSELTAGERQLSRIILTISRKADLYLLDEPQKDLNENQLSWFISKIQTLPNGDQSENLQQKPSVLITTESQELCQKLSSETIRIEEGVLYAK